MSGVFIAAHISVKIWVRIYIFFWFKSLCVIQRLFLNLFKVMEDKEIWKSVPGYDGLYEVSSFGRIKSLPKNVVGRSGCNRYCKEKIMKPTLKNNGYFSIALYNAAGNKKMYVHRLVCLCFYGESELHVNHVDGDKSNNHLYNLEYVSQRENNCHMFSKKNKGKLIGVKKNFNRYMAVIRINGKHIYNGSYDTEIEAHEAYLSALKERGIENKYATQNQDHS